MNQEQSSNTYWQNQSVSQHERAQLKGQKPCCIWLTGLSGAGKSTIANLLEQKMHDQGLHTYLLDGDNVRHGLNKDLGFTDGDRQENIRRISEVAKLMVDAGLIVIVAFISPFRRDRVAARQLFHSGQFVKVFVDAPLEECARRDPKQLYKKAKRGDISNFTGLGSRYEPPETPDIVVKTDIESPGQCVEKIYNYYVRISNAS